MTFCIVQFYKQLFCENLSWFFPRKYIPLQYNPFATLTIASGYFAPMLMNYLPVDSSYTGRDGELPEDAVVREVFEETGVKIKPVGMITIRCQSGEWYMVLKAEYIEGEPCVNLSENDDVIFMNISDALNHPCVTDTAKTLIQAALINKTIPAKDCRKNRMLYSINNIV